MLIILGGLPGTGKSTIGQALAKKMRAVYLRIDSIEQALRNDVTVDREIYAEGYITAYAIARDNLNLGLSVIADSVNSVDITRQHWRQTAQDCGKCFFEIELICRDKRIHQLRIESRESDIVGLQYPTWDEVLSRQYDTWDAAHFVLDTSSICVEDAVDEIIQQVQMMR